MIEMIIVLSVRAPGAARVGAPRLHSAISRESVLAVIAQIVGVHVDA